MKAEKVILSFVALLIGLAVAGGAFFFYEQTKSFKQQEGKTKSVQITIPSPTPPSVALLEVSHPKDGEVVSKNTVTINGHTQPNTIVAVRSETDEQVGISAANGSFTFTLSLEKGANPMQIIAFLPDGSEKSEIRTITFTTEDF
jgi:hypothetical protein